MDPFFRTDFGKTELHSESIIKRPRDSYEPFIWVDDLGYRGKIPRLQEEIMKKSAITFAILATLIFTVSVSAEKSTEDHIKALSSGSDQEKIEASRYLGDKKEKSAIPELINLLNRANDPKVAVPAGIALGQIGEAGDSTIALKNKVISSDNGDIVYTALVSILNIVIKNEKAEDAAKEAVEFADKNRRSDEFVSDFLNVLTKKLKG